MLNCYTPVVEPARVAPSVTARPDGRAWHEARRPRIALGVIARVAGSARVALGGTLVLSTVTGPHAPAVGDAAAGGSDVEARGRLACTLGFAPFARAHLPAASPPPLGAVVRAGAAPPPALRPPLLGGGALEADAHARTAACERELAAAVGGALERTVQLRALARHEVRVHVMVLQADGAELAAAIVGASLALADAGVPLRDLAPACAVCVAPTSPAAPLPRAVLDPCAAEASGAAGALTLAMSPASREVTQWRMRGCFDAAAGSPDGGLAAAVELCVTGCAGMHELMRAALLARHAEEAAAAAAVALDDSSGNGADGHAPAR